MRLKDTGDISKSHVIKLWPLSSKDGAKKYEESDMNNHAYSLYFSFLSLSTLLIPHSKILKLTDLNRSLKTLLNDFQVREFLF